MSSKKPVLRSVVKPKRHQKTSSKTQNQFRVKLKSFTAKFSQLALWKRCFIVLIALVFALFTLQYSVYLWYFNSEKGKPYQLGVTYVPTYARSLGLDPVKTYDAILHDLGVRHLRIVSYWNEIEPTQGTFNFDELDWQFREANKVGAKINLAIGLRQPRWPECHAPNWVDITQPRAAWQPQLETFMTKVIMRYKDNPALETYQLENEYFNTVFGGCHDFSRTRLIEELALVKSLDANTPVIISRSNNSPTIMLRNPKTDIHAFTLYRIVYDQTLTKRYYLYPFPTWHYGAVAGWQKLIGGQESMIHELQAEPWPPSNSGGVQGITVEEQSKTMDAQKLRDNVEFAKKTGMHTIDLWGAEYWYYRMVIEKDPSVWNEARDIFHNPDK